MLAKARKTHRNSGLTAAKAGASTFCTKMPWARKDDTTGGPPEALRCSPEEYESKRHPASFSTQAWVLSMEEAASTTAGRKGSKSCVESKGPR